MYRNHLEAVAHRKDGSFALAGSSLTGNIWDGALWYFDSWEDYKSTPNLQLVATPTHTGHSDIKWYSNQSLLLLAADSGELEVWHVVPPGNELEWVDSLSGGHGDMILSLSVGGDLPSSTVVSGGADGKICLWDMTSTKLQSCFKGHVGWLTGLDHNPHQSDIFISTGMDCLLKIWDARCHDAMINCFTGPGGISCQCVSWSSSNDNLIATGNLSGSIYCHDIRSTQEPLLSHELHTNTVHRISFSPTLNGLVSTVSDDCTAKIFHFPSKSVIFSSSDFHKDFVHGLSWKPGSASLLTCGWDGKICEHEFNDALASLLETISEEESTVKDDDMNESLEEGSSNLLDCNEELSTQNEELTQEAPPTNTFNKSKLLNGCVDAHP